MTILAGSIVVLAALLGVVLTFITLPGIWFAVLVALLIEIWKPELLGWWTLGGAIAVALLAEVAEFVASAAGSGRAGGSRAGMIGSIAGSMLGLLVGQVLIPIPIIGAMIGAVIGAGAGTLLAERQFAKRSWDESILSSKGAATGRALSIVVKGAFAIVAAMVLIAGVLVP